MKQAASLRERMAQIKFLLSDDNVALIGDFGLRLKVLEQLGYTDQDRTVQLKGRVACEVYTLCTMSDEVMRCGTCDMLLYAD